MRILLINPPYITWSARFGTGHQMPAGLLRVGGPLLDGGHEVRLLDAERRHLTLTAILKTVKSFRPDIVMTGHAGSTAAHPTCIEMLKTIKTACPGVMTVYGGVYPTFHARQIMEAEKCIDVIIRGEGEAVASALVTAIESGTPLHRVEGIAYRDGGRLIWTRSPQPICDMDAYRTGWELIENWGDYRCFGLGRAAILQFSRGCPHRCTYCGQRGFWKRWRHRDPVKAADEIEWLYRAHHVKFISLADENPATDRKLWHHFLKEIAGRKIPVHLFTSIRTTDIVRDADILPLYKAAGIQYVLLGIESTTAKVLRKIKKGSTTREDLNACRLLKKNGIFSIVAHVVGLREETFQTFRTALRQLIYYDGDLVNVTHVTPHRWTGFGRGIKAETIIQRDLGKWDYRHQILSQRRLSPAKLFFAVKWLEFRFHARPVRLWAILRTRDPFLRRQLIWCFLHTAMVWFGEVLFTRIDITSVAGAGRSSENRWRWIFRTKGAAAGVPQSPV